MDNQQPQKFDLEALRAKLAGKQGKQYWRGLEEIADTPEFQAWIEDEFPNRRSIADIDRRTFLKFMGASMALAGLTGCRGYFLPEEKIVPYVKQPEEVTIGKPLFYASAFTHAGYGYGVLVEQNEGRPTKVEGNNQHPESRGRTNSWVQASILSVYDPDRAQNVLDREKFINTWDAFLKEGKAAFATQKQKRGAGLRILTGAVTSPTMAAQLAHIKNLYPQATWHTYEPFGRSAAYEGAEAVFGKPLEPNYDFTKAKVIVSLDSDFLSEIPGHLRYAMDFVNGRRVTGRTGTMNRLYAFESTPTITGAMGDHRWAVKGSAINGIAQALLSAVSGINRQFSNAAPSGIKADQLAAVVADLQANRGTSIVIAGEHQPASVHAAALAINAALGNIGETVNMIAPVQAGVAAGPVVAGSLKDLTDALNKGGVEMLMIVGGNPVFDAPSDLRFADAVAKAGISVHYTGYNNETSKVCTWNLPGTTYLEEWSDVRAHDGTVSIVQPLILPIFPECRSIHEVFSSLLNENETGYNIVRSVARHTYITQGDFEAKWRRALHDGIVAGSAYPTLGGLTSSSQAMPSVPAVSAGPVEIMFRPDPSIHDGRYANNGWLMELPRPMTKIVWDNAFQMSPTTADKLGIVSEALCEVTCNGVTLQGGAFIEPGHPEDSVTIFTGYGRTVGGNVAVGAGMDAYTLRKSDNPSFAGGSIKAVGGWYPIATTQLHHSMEGRDIIRFGTLNEFLQDPANLKHSEGEDEDISKMSMYPDQVFDTNLPQWGMTIDLNACIGCNACVTACQAENNIPVVGKQQVKRGREMHWIRIDRYYTADGDYSDPISNPEPMFQPLMCVHCEKAPCEPVCPVAATVHSHEGLNQMIYNRCVGTRYCSNNCPYKVRRFNFFNYTDNQPNFSTTTMDIHGVPGPLHTPKESGISLLKMLSNPDVTVRGRGVMEKCTYCTQRISQTRIEAKKLGREIQDGEILTACQQACPTDAIVFGNIMDTTSRVAKLRKDPRSYLLLKELQTRPRTSYLARLRNPNPALRAVTRPTAEPVTHE